MSGWNGKELAMSVGFLHWLGIREFDLDEFVKCVHSGWQCTKKLWKFTIQ